MGREGRAAGCTGPHTVGTPAQHVRRSPSLTHAPTQVRGNKPSCLLAQQNRGKLFTVYKPNIGRQSQLETLDSLCRRFHRVGPDGPAVRPHCTPGAPVFCSPQAGPPPPCSAALAARRRMSGPGAFGPPVPHLRAGEHGQAAVQGLNRLCPQVTAEEAREHWESSYTFSLTHCSHTTW